MDVIRDKIISQQGERTAVECLYQLLGRDGSEPTASTQPSGQEDYMDERYYIGDAQVNMTTIPLFQWGGMFGIKKFCR